ncbi:hypothetical protein ACN261_14890 [Micromonospora sp. WMMD723]|uniref:hypothetical protein n=1 Tax=Micromonospora sp. WMMD723 TaxID=3403465 RepID=UPI003CEF75FE
MRYSLGVQEHRLRVAGHRTNPSNADTDATVLEKDLVRAGLANVDDPDHMPTLADAHDHLAKIRLYTGAPGGRQHSGHVGRRVVRCRAATVRSGQWRMLPQGDRLREYLVLQPHLPDLKFPQFIAVVDAFPASAG